MDKTWYYTQSASQEKKGPVPEAEIKSLIAAGQILKNDLLWTNGMSHWEPLNALPQLQSSLPTTPTPLSSPMLHSMPVPEGLTGWMTFMAVMTIIMGVFQCLNCIGIIIGIPTIIAGSALLAAKNSIANIDYVDSSLSVFFDKLKSFLRLSGIIYIVSFIVMGVIIVLYFGVIMAAIASKAGVRP